MINPENAHHISELKVMYSDSSIQQPLVKSPKLFIYYHKWQRKEGNLKI